MERSIAAKIFTAAVLAGLLLAGGACNKDKDPTPLQIKVVNNTAGITGTYPGYVNEEVRVKPSDLGAGIDQKRLAAYKLTRDGNGLDRLVAFTNTGQELSFIANDGTGYALMTYTPVTTSKGDLYDLIDAHPGLALIARDVKVYRSDDAAFPPTSFPSDPNGLIQEAVTDLGEGLHPGGFSLGSITWSGSGNLAAGYTGYNADGVNVAGKAYVNWTKIRKQAPDDISALRLAKLTFKSEMLGGISAVGDIGGDTRQFVEDQALLNAVISYLFSRN